MAILALAAAGAALAPAGYAAIGWTVGSVLGQLLFPGKAPDRVGPRLNDLRVQQSQYGVAIPIVFGTDRIAGNIIWSTDLRETEVRTSSGGKGGGPSQTSISYTYRRSFAVMLGRGELAGIRKIWEDSTLIYSVGDDADPGTVAASSVVAPGITFYTGSDSQLPDPTMEAELGTGNVPAYRGRAYVVFADRDQTRNTSPNYTFEVVRSGTVGDTFEYMDLPAAGGFGYRGAAYGNGIFMAIKWEPTAFATISTDGRAWTKTFEFPPGVALLVLGFGAGEFITMAGSSGSCFASADGVSWTSFTGPPLTNKNKLVHNGEYWMLFGQGGTAYRSEDGRVWEAVNMPFSLNWTEAVWTGQRWIVNVPSSTTCAFSPDGRSWSVSAMPRAGQWRAMGTNGTVTICLAQNDGNEHAISTDGGATWATLIVSETGAQWNQLLWTGEFFVALAGSTVTAYAVSTDLGATWSIRPQPEPIGLVYGMYVNGVLVAVPGVVSSSRGAILRFDVLTPDAHSLADAVTEICAEVGLAAGDLDVTELSDTIAGYTIGQQMPARSALETLQRAYTFDAVESGLKIAFRTRGRSVSMAIAEDDLGAHSAGDTPPEPLSLTRQQEVELPRVVSVLYKNSANDYQQGAQQAMRSTTLSQQQTSVEVPVVLTDDEARGIAEMLLYDAWTQRARYTVQTTLEYSMLEPADVVTVTRDNVTATLRIERKVESRTGVVLLECVAEEASLYTQSVLGGASLVPDQSVGLPPLSVMAFGDWPLLRDQDNTQGVYLAARGQLAAGYRGTVVYRSADGGGTYDETVAITTPAVIGSALVAIGNYLGGNTFDESTVLDVLVGDGQVLESFTDLAIYNGSGHYMVGSECLQAKRAVLIATNTYRLTGLLRGRRGTEWAMSTHVAGERVVYLAPSALSRTSADLSLARLYKPVTIGRTLQETDAESRTYTGVNLKPFAPAQLGGFRNEGTWTINWLVRSRLGTTLGPFFTRPAYETLIRFDIEIWNNTFTVLRRTFADRSGSSVNYTGAEQITDAGSVQSTIYVRVYQLSPLLTRGYVLQGALSV
jgi:hypothetical protein